MAEKWQGSIVQIDCGDVLGTFEGVVSNVDSVNQTISLTKVSRNSVACEMPEVTLRSCDIKSLQILKSAMKNSLKTNTVINQTGDSAFSKPAAVVKQNVIESPAAEEIARKRDGKKKSAKRGENKKWLSDKDEACFSVPLDSNVFDTDFDFEKNLALFDKQAVFNEINALSKCDQNVRLVDCNKRCQPKYRHDENVLGSETPVLKQISVPCTSQKEYVTDSGLVVPSVTKEFKEALFKKAEESGLSVEVRLEMTGRAASEMVLQLLGGSHRLNPQNTHQRPTAVILCGPHVQGAQGINCGRQLANHHVNVTVLCSPASTKANEFYTRELNLFFLTGGVITSNTQSLPPTVDIIIGCLNPHDNKDCPDPNWLQLAKMWANQCKAPILCLDPLPENGCLKHKWILSPALPFAFRSDNCSVYICDIGLPSGVFIKVESAYSSPFGSKFVIPLYSKKS